MLGLGYIRSLYMHCLAIWLYKHTFKQTLFVFWSLQSHKKKIYNIKVVYNNNQYSVHIIQYSSCHQHQPLLDYLYEREFCRYCKVQFGFKRYIDAPLCSIFFFANPSPAPIPIDFGIVIAGIMHCCASHFVHWLFVWKDRFFRLIKTDQNDIFSYWLVSSFVF